MLIPRNRTALGQNLEAVEKDWKGLLANNEQTFLTDNQLSVFVDERNPGCQRVHFYPLPFPHRFSGGRLDFQELMNCSSLHISGPQLDLKVDKTRLNFLPSAIEKEMTAGDARVMERCAVSENTMALEWSIAGRDSVTLILSLPHFRAAVEEISHGILFTVNDQVFAAVSISGAKELSFETNEEPSGCRVRIVMNEGGELSLGLSCGYDRDTVLRDALDAAENPNVVFQAAEDTWNDYFTKIVPHFSCSDIRLEHLYYYQAYVTRANLYDIPYEPFTHLYTCPWKGGAIYQWSWNTPMESVHERWLNDKAVGAGGILLLGDNGGGLNLGAYLHPLRKEAAHKNHGDFFKMIREYQRELPPDCDMVTCTTLPHTTPNGLLGAWEYYLCSGDDGFLRRALDIMIGAESSFSSHALENGLCTCTFVDEFDYSLRLKPFIKNFKKGDPNMMFNMDTPFIAVDYNCYLHSLRERIVEAARILGLTDIDTDTLIAKNAKLKAAINHYLWDEADGFYYDADPRDMKRSGVKCIAGFAALYAGIADDDQAAVLVGHLTNPEEFGTTYPCPSISVDTPDVDPSLMTYGGDSMITSGIWFTVEGLVRYGYRELAAQYVLRSLEMVYREGPSSAYSYHCMTGTPNQEKHTLSSQSCILTDLICRYLIGMHPKGEGVFEINPLALPASGIDSFTFGPYRYWDKVVTVKWSNGKSYEIGVREGVGG